MNWMKNAHKVEDEFGGFVDWDEEYYICPECGEPVYADDWTGEELADVICPICEFSDED